MIDLSDRVGEIARILMGAENPKHLTRAQLRFGSNGSLAVEIAGAKRGQWYDQENQIGGGPLKLIEVKGGIANGEVADWLRDKLGINAEPEREQGQRRRIAATYDYRSEAGVLLYQAVRYEPRGFKQRRPDGSGWAWKLDGVRRVPYRLPELIAAPLDTTVYIAEGEKDVDNLVKLGLATTCNSEGAGKWRAEFAAFFRGRGVVLFPDNDKAGRAHAAAVAATLAPVARRVRVVELPGLSPKGDVSDFFAAGGTLEELERIVAAAPDFTIEPDDVDRASTAGAGTIAIVAGLRHVAADAGLAALHAAGVPFYQRDQSIVRVCMIPAKAATGEVTFTPGLIGVEPAYLARELGRAARWEKFDRRQGAMVRIDPPRDVVEQIGDMAGEWPFPLLAGVIGTPTMRPDGSLLLAEGYDEATGLVLLGAPRMPHIAEEPTRQDAEAALALIEALLAEFPFRDGGGRGSVDRGVALSEMLTPVLRGAMSAAPMHLANAPQPGTGKSYLADLASGIATGERCAVVAFSTNPEETEKKIIGSALAGHPIIALDNASGTVEGDLLCQITERPLLQLRPLGTSKMVRVANTFTVLSNGNNAIVAADMVRRTIECRLDANMEAPETRTFRDNPLARVMRDRGAYIAASLTIVRAYLCAGKPGRLPPLASYEAWSDLVRSPLVWLGCGDPVASMVSLRSLDPTHQDRVTVFKAWAPELGTGAYLTADLIARANDQEPTGVFFRPGLRAAFLDIATDRRGEIDAKRLGRWLAKTENTVAADFKMTRDKGDATRPRWKLVHV